MIYLKVSANPIPTKNFDDLFVNLTEFYVHIML